MKRTLLACTILWATVLPVITRQPAAAEQAAHHTAATSQAPSAQQIWKPQKTDESKILSKLLVLFSQSEWTVAREGSVKRNNSDQNNEQGNHESDRPLALGGGGPNLLQESSVLPG